MATTVDSGPVKLAPTTEAIDAWLDRNDGSWPCYGVDIKTKAGSWRCITSSSYWDGYQFYWTIRGEGSSNEGRETAIREDRIVQARGWKVD